MVIFHETWCTMKTFQHFYNEMFSDKMSQTTLSKVHWIPKFIDMWYLCMYNSTFRRWIENWIACHLVKLSKENFCHRFLIKEQGNYTKHHACVSEASLFVHYNALCCIVCLCFLKVWLMCPNAFILCNTYPEASMASDVWHKFTGKLLRVDDYEN